MATIRYSQQAFLAPRRRRKRPWPASTRVFVFAVFCAAMLYASLRIFTLKSLSQTAERAPPTGVQNDTSSNRLAESRALQKSGGGFYLSWWYEGTIERSQLNRGRGRRRRRHAFESFRVPLMYWYAPISPTWKIKTGDYPDSGPRTHAPPFEGMTDDKRPDWAWERKLANVEGEGEGEGEAEGEGERKREGGKNVKKMTPWTLRSQEQVEGPVVCWNGGALRVKGGKGGRGGEGGEGGGEGGESSLGEIIQVSGEGCKRCIVGLSCEFLLKFTHSDRRKRNFFRRQELVVTLSGPAVMQAEVFELTTQSATAVLFSVLYQLWDAGTYVVSVTSDCYPASADPPQTSSRVLAEFELTVFSSPTARPPANSARPSAPCEVGLSARWRVEGRTAYHSPYECAGDLTPVSSIVEMLVSKEMEEISFVGGSHQLALFLHLQSYLTGGNFSHNIFDKKDISWVFTASSSNFTLKMNFYWLENIIPDKKYGCGDTPYYAANGDRRAEGNFLISPKSRMIFLEATSWVFENCRSAEAAHVRFLPWFLDNFAWWYANSKALAHVFWRTAPPRPLPSLPRACERGPGNRALRRANVYARTLVERHGFSYLDFWPVESAFYYSTCYEGPSGDSKENRTLLSYYSCLTNNGTVMNGTIGEAVLETFVHKLSYYPTPVDW